MEKQEKKYPLVVTGSFIFNDKDELFLMKSPQWKNKYICPGGKVEIGETIEQATKRETKEETNIDIKEIELLGVLEGLDVDKHLDKKYKHLIFLNNRAIVKNAKKIILNEEGTKYKWLRVSEWLVRDDLGKYTKEALDKFLGEKDEYKDMYKRALADYQNLLKQGAQEKQEFLKYANEQIVYDLIPVFDNLKLAIKHADEKAQENPWFAGVVHVTKQLEDVLSNIGLEELKAEGLKFDHNTMEALEKEETEDKKKDGFVSKIMKPGYKLKDKIINHTKVVVYEYIKK
ncbi:MAG: nucleotide exchange factor GrpE [Patescibacteria group bacterium]|jgi:molecular chaperone GrpE|nr:nucleotide exchange factor GrpE [Patescibacteria group bacterium]